MQYQGSLNLGKCAVLCSDLSSRHTGDVPLVLLMDRVLSVGWCQARIEDCGVMGQGDGHNVEAKRSCTSGKCRDLLVWPWAGRVETRLPMMNWRVSPFWWFIPWGQGCWGPHLSCQKEEKALEVWAGLVEIPGDQEAVWAGVCNWHEKIMEWLQEDMDRSFMGGQTLCPIHTALDSMDNQTALNAPRDQELQVKRIRGLGSELN